MPCKALFLAVVEGCLHGLGWVVCLDIVPQRQAFDGKTVFLSALRRVFSKFGRLYRERARRFFFGPALRKTGAFLFAVRIGQCLRGFWRQIKEAPGISRFFGDVRESFGCRLEDSTGETIFLNLI